VVSGPILEGCNTQLTRPSEKCSTDTHTIVTIKDTCRNHGMGHPLTLSGVVLCERASVEFIIVHREDIDYGPSPRLYERDPYFITLWSEGLFMTFGVSDLRFPKPSDRHALLHQMIPKEHM
jgi:hypothetical protein